MKFLRNCGAILISGWRRKACFQGIRRQRAKRTTFRRPGIRKIGSKKQRAK